MNQMFKKAVFAVFISATALSANAWDGWDSGVDGGVVEIQKGNLVRPGKTIEIYDYGRKSGYRDVEVESVKRRGNRVEVEVYDSELGETRIFEMED